MSDTFKLEPLVGGDDAVWGDKELSQNRLSLGLTSCLLYDDSGTLKISQGQIGFDDGTNKGVSKVAAVRTISMAGVSSGNWAKIEMTITAGAPVFSATDILGATTAATIPTEFTGAWDGNKQGYYISATKRCLGLAWKTGAGALSGVINVFPGYKHYRGTSAAANVFWSIGGIDLKAIDILTAFSTAGLSLKDVGGTERAKVIDSVGLGVSAILRALTAAGLRLEDDGGNLGGGIEDGGYGYMVPRSSLTAALAANTIYTIAHGIGSPPTTITVKLKCISTEHGWAVDEEIVLASFVDGVTGNGAEYGSDATNITFQTGTNIAIKNKATNAAAYITMNKWKALVKWWR